MRKLSLIAAFGFGIVLFAACNKNESKQQQLIAEPENETVLEASRVCASHEVLEEQMQADPSRRARLEELESFTRKYIQNPSAYRLLADGTIEIPIHFNVVYKTSAENISNAQLQTQVDVLNEDYGYTNADRNNISTTVFAGVVAGPIKIKFSWDPATGTTRKASTKTSWRTNDDVKRTSRGGIDPTSPTTKLNIWVCNLSNSILGYAQFPGGPAATDGVVLDNNCTGRGSGYSLFANYNLGRTATHEVGHWLNLRHIWGDATCGNDQVNDTPTHNTSNGGCPTYPHLSTCAGTPIEMTMNYMDYTYDRCMYMFSAGQAARMMATFSSATARASFAQ